MMMTRKVQRETSHSCSTRHAGCKPRAPGRPWEEWHGTVIHVFPTGRLNYWPEIPEPADIGTKHTLPGTPRGVKAWRCCQGFVKTAVWTFGADAQDHDAEAAAVIGGTGKNCVPTCGEQGADRQSVGRHGGVHCCWRDRGGHGMFLLVAIRLAGFCSDEVIGTGSLVCSTCPKTAAVSESTTPPGPDP